jgi:ferritin-like metal-binding protein YciE
MEAKMEDPRDRLVRYLDDACAMETGAATVFQTFLDEANYPAAKQEIEAHLMAAKEHGLLVERRLRELGGHPSASKGFFNTMMGKLTDMLQGAHDAYDKTTQDLIKSYAMDHLCVGAYAALAAFSRAYGDVTTAELAEKIMAENVAAADRVRPHIAEAAGETFKAAVQKAA